MTTDTAFKPEITRWGILSTQVCVPADFSDEQAIAFAEQTFPCGTVNGWQIRRAGDEALNGAPERMPCSDRDGCVHIMLDA